MSPFKALIRTGFTCVVLLLMNVTAGFAANAGTVRGHVLGEDGKPISGVAVQLRNDITGFRQDAISDAEGAFAFTNIPLNQYEIHVDVQGFQPLHADIDVHSVVAVDKRLVLKVAALTESIDVNAEPPAAQLETDNTQSHVDVDKSYIARAPAASATRAMEQIVTATPGFSKDENGRFHFQGAHSQSEYVIDGQTISDQTGVTFSNSIDPGIAQGIEIIYGNVPAEYGEKIGAVINLTTKSGLASGSPKGEALLGAGSFGTQEAAFSLGSGSQTFGYFGSIDASKSDRFLDPVNFDNLNNHGDTVRGFLRLDFAPGASDSFRMTALVGQTNRDVPNTFTQAAAGQDQQVKTADENVNLGWDKVLSPSSVLEVIGFGRLSKFTLSSTNGTPVDAASNRTLNNFGVSPSYSWTGANQELKIGGTYKSFPIKEHFAFGITDPNLNDPSSPDYNPNLAPYDLTRGGTPFVFDGQRTGTYYAGYVQDNIRLRSLTANIGFRYDHNNLPISESDFEPRLGLAYYVDQTKTVFRLSYDRVMYTPEYENILMSSSPQTAALAPPSVMQSQQLGGGDLLVHSERQNAFDTGVQQAIGRYLRLDLDYWKRQARFSGDQDQFLGTGIVFPLDFQRGHYDGWNVRLDMARVAGFRGFLSLGHTHAVYVPPLAGGLFLDAGALDTLTGGPFLIDHDEKLQAQTGLFYDFGHSGVWTGMNVRYDSGLVAGSDVEGLLGDPDNGFAAPFIVDNGDSDLDPARIKPRTIIDLSFGSDLKQFHMPFILQADLLNVTNKKGLYNVDSTFGGTHVIPPRTLSVRLRYAF